MLERLVAGIVVIGALVWVASTLATPDAPPDLRDEAAIVPEGSGDPLPELPDASDGEPTVEPAGDREDDDEDDEDGSSGRRKKGRDGGDADA